ncbi:MAG: ribosome biogenesis GTPase Der [Candidatus Tectimicrobiota bacterium]
MSAATVAIVGRPNVGKSTLFNRLLGHSVALVDGTAGVTRDRHYGEVEWLGQTFQLIDTGGIVTGSVEAFVQAIREQTESAIAEADVLLFVLDGRQGVTTLDQEVASQLRKIGKSVILVVNKIEGKDCLPEVTLLYQLGFGEPFFISAEHGQGIGDLLETVVTKLPQGTSAKTENPGIQVAVVGRPNVGKSSLINRILGYQRLLVDNSPGTTRDAIDSVVRVNKKYYTLVDTAGMRKFRRISETLEEAAVAVSLKRIRRCDVAILLLDALAGLGSQDTRIATYIERQGKSCIVAINKWDAVEKTHTTYETFVRTIQESMPFLAHAPILSVSALTGQRLSKLFPYIDATYLASTKRVPTSQLHEFLQRVTQEHAAPLYHGRVVKFSFLLQTVVQPPTFCCFVNRPEGVSQTYQRYLENQLRRQFGFAGVPIRLNFRKK